MKTKIRHSFFIFIGTFVLFNIVFIPPIFRKKISINEGEIANFDVIAPYDFSIPRGTDELSEEREGIEKRMPPIFEQDNTLIKQINKRLSSIEQTITSFPRSAKRDSLVSLLEKEYGFTDELARYLIRANHKILRKLSNDLSRVYSPWGVMESDPLSHRIITIIVGDNEHVVSIDEIPSLARAESIAVSGTYDGLYRDLVRFFLKPSLTYNETKTQQRIEEVFANVPRTKRDILKGEIIIEKHRRVSKEAIENLMALEKTYVTIGTWDIVKTVLFRNLVYFVVMFLLFRYNQITKLKILDMKNLYFLSLLFAVYLVIGKITYETNTVYLLPISFFAFLMALYFNFHTAIFFTLIFAGMFGVILNSLSIFTYLLASGLVAGFSSQTLRTRLSMYRPLFYIGITNVLIIMFIDVSLNNRAISLLSLGEGFLNSVIGSVAVVLLLPLFERVFDFTTDLTLLELGNLNLPIFKDMSLNSPGTFHHSVVVGNLAEAGASAIGADPILARVGAYYHDIGKIKKADYFIENQIGIKNPHDNLKPQMSALVIISHVKEGIDMAKEMRLPRKLTDIIAEHHGATVVELFYRKAVHLTEEVSEDAFRYPGPKPKTKEAALVMLADNVEAAARSERNITVTKLQKILKDNFDRKFNDGQLDDCPINRYDLELVKTAFLPILNGIFHPRLGYEEPEKAPGVQNN